MRADREPVLPPGAGHGRCTGTALHRRRFPPHAPAGAGGTSKHGPLMKPARGPALHRRRRGQVTEHSSAKQTAVPDGASRTLVEAGASLLSLPLHSSLVLLAESGSGALSPQPPLTSGRSAPWRPSP